MRQESPGRAGAGERVTIARTLDDLQRVMAIRAIAYVDGQDCPYDEEFDGNDLCAMHLLGWLGDEPAATLRMRFFGDFAKIERLAVRPEQRRSTLAVRLVREALRIAARKGFRRAYGHAQAGLESFWSRFGAREIGARGAFAFSGRRYTEMLLELPADPRAIGLGADPMLIVRPEGDWDRPGVLERTGAPASREELAWSADIEAAWRTSFRPDQGFREAESGWIDERMQAERRRRAAGTRARSPIPLTPTTRGSRDSDRGCRGRYCRTSADRPSA
jgi:predicted GNAT family N-acyltransferase